jgi:flagellar FliL protein
MAENTTEAPAAVSAKGGSKKKLIIILAAALLLGGGAGYYFLVKKPADEKALAEKKEAGGDAAAEEHAEKDATPPVTMALDIFTANIQPIDAEKYLQVGLVLKIKVGGDAGKGAVGVDAFKPYIPDIRNAVIAKMAELKAEDITGNEKREALRVELKDAIKASLPSAMGRQLTDVLYTQFVMQ